MTPMRLETDAAQIAAGTLPPAIEVKAIEDCTVEGSTDKNSSPIVTVAPRIGLHSVASSRPISGNST